MFAWLLFIAAALLAVGGNAAIRLTLRGGSISSVVAGFGLLACYSLAVNSFKWDFSRLMCVYIGLFALVHLLVRRFILKEIVPLPTWFGLELVLTGGVVIQFG
jgi:drug/metabolite transporter superfamily protein YnfA